MAVPEATAAHEVSLAELLKPGRRERLALSDQLSVSGDGVLSWLANNPPGIVPRKGSRTLVGEA